MITRKVSDRKFLRKSTVAQRYSVTPRSIDRWWTSGRFPKPQYPIGRTLPLWSVAELDAFDARATNQPAVA
jgi:predicted DNA-binding transcriptional regulator AlpA